MAKQLKISFVIAIVFINHSIIIAQPNNNYVFSHIDQHDGLAHNNVFDITQDKRGFIWLITTNGLQRYDGLRFVNYNDSMNVSYGLNQEANVYADSNNTIWITEPYDIQKLQTTKNIFTVYQPEQLLHSTSFTCDTFTDEHNKKWLLTRQGAFYYDNLSGKFKCKFLNIHPYTKNESNYFFTDNTTGNTWTISEDGLILFDIKTKKVFSENYNPQHNEVLAAFKKKLQEGQGRRIIMDRNYNIWIITWGGLFYKYDLNAKQIFTYSLAGIENKDGKKNITSPASVNCMYEDDHGALWATTDYGGLLKYDTIKNTFAYIFLNEKNNQSLFFNYQVFCIFQDKDENIWLGTDNGITIFNPYRQYFQSVHHEENNSSVPKSEIQGFIQTLTGDILVGTWGGGIALYDSTWNFKKLIQSVALAYEGNLIWSFIQNDDGNIWVGCQHGYIHIYNPLNETIHTIQPPELDNSTIRCMAKDANGNIWFGLHNGKIAEWNKKRNAFYSMSLLNSDNKNVLPSITFIYFDKQNNCWACTAAGLKKFDINRRLFTDLYLPNLTNPFSISSKNIEGIEQYDDTTLMIGTSFGGMNFFNTKTKIFTHFNTQNDFPSNTVHSIKKDAAGYVWFTTDYSLYKYKPSEKKFTSYNIEPGVINSAFNAAQLYVLKNGYWCTSTSTEIIYFNSQTLSTQKTAATRVEIAGLKIFDKPFFVDSFLANRKPVELKYKENFLTIEFAALNFSNILQTTYYYKLSDVNSDWVDAGTRKSVTYTNLEPGNYIFTVKADNGNSLSKETSFEIIIEPPFWKTAWFIILCLLLVASIIYLLVRRRVNMIRSKAELKQKIAETEMIALRAQMNPHFIFNCLNSIDNLIQTNEKEKATTYLAKFAKLIRAILENSKHNTIPCWKDLETLKLYLELEELRWGKKISYTLNIAPEILQGDYKVPPMIIQPYVENAIHHGLLNKENGNRQLLIEVKAEKNYINYLIEDNGIGRKKAMEYKLLNKPTHQSMGLDITYDRINLFNQNNNGSVTITDLYNEYKEAIGTNVMVILVN